MLHAGLGRLLQAAMPLECAGWTLTQVQPTETVGNNPSYGMVTILEWQSTSPAGNGTDQLLRQGIGLLLAGGTGMATDLGASSISFTSAR